MMPVRAMYVAVSKLFVRSFAHIQYLSRKVKLVIGQGVVKVHGYVVVANLRYSAHQLVAVGIVHGQVLAYFYALVVKFAVYVKRLLVDLHDHVGLGHTVAAGGVNFKIEAVACFFVHEVLFEIGQQLACAE